MLISMQELKPDISEQMNKMKKMKVVFKQGFQYGSDVFLMLRCSPKFSVETTKKVALHFLSTGFFRKCFVNNNQASFSYKKFSTWVCCRAISLGVIINERLDFTTFLRFNTVEKTICSMHVDIIHQSF